MSIATDTKVFELEARVKKLESDVELLLQLMDKPTDVSRGTQKPTRESARRGS
jgi:hypothetical protein